MHFVTTLSSGYSWSECSPCGSAVNLLYEHRRDEKGDANNLFHPYFPEQLLCFSIALSMEKHATSFYQYTKIIGAVSMATLWSHDTRAPTQGQNGRCGASSVRWSPHRSDCLPQG
jgi:hypothetical protein